MPLTHKEMEDRIKQISEEFGLEMNIQEISEEESGIDGKVVSLGSEMAELPPDKMADLERLRYELQTDLHGRHISFSTETLQPGDARVSPKSIDPVEMEHIHLKWASDDLKSILALARVGAILTPFIMADDGANQLSDETMMMQVREAVSSDLPSPPHYMAAVANTAEMAQACAFMARIYGHDRDMSAIENVTPEDIIGGGSE